MAQDAGTGTAGLADAGAADGGAADGGASDAGAPLDAAEAKALIARTKAGVKIKGYRGKPALHETSAVKALVGLSNLIAYAGDRVASIDINPFLLNAKTGIAVDALIVLNNAAAKHGAQDHGR